MTVTKPALAERLLNWYALPPGRCLGAGLPTRMPCGYLKSCFSKPGWKTVIPYFTLDGTFSHLAVLSAASEQDVLAAWEGLGYYSRKRDLWKAARQVQAEHGGNIPATAAGLRSLRVSAYTAATITSIAFGQDEAPWMGTSGGCWHGCST